MQICLKDNPNLKWIIITVVACIVFATCVGDGELELIGNLFLMAGQVLVILALS